MSTDLIADWQNRFKKSRKQIDKQLRQLQRKKGKKLDKQAAIEHDKVFKQLDCLDCANCCTSIPPIVTRTDSSRIAKRLGLKTKDFQATYLVLDEDRDWVMNASPCPFLLQ